MVDVTKKYMNALSAFSCDFEIAKRYSCQHGRVILNLPDSVKLQRDIELLAELEAKLRYEQLKIMEETDDDL
jgi:hypothetical protein